MTDNDTFHIKIFVDVRPMDGRIYYKYFYRTLMLNVRLYY